MYQTRLPGVLHTRAIHQCSLKVAERFVDWFSCWTRALINSHVPLLAIITIHHVLIPFIQKIPRQRTGALRYHGQKLIETFQLRWYLIFICLFSSVNRKGLGPYIRNKIEF